MLSRLREQFPRSGRIVETERIARRMKRLRIEGDGLRDLLWSPGQQLRVRLAPSIFMRDSLRTYSVGPRGRFVLDPEAPYHLFAGEETGRRHPGDDRRTARRRPRPLPARSRHARGRASVRAPDIDLRWVHRRGRPAGPDSGLVDTVRRLELPRDPGVAYVAGEAVTCIALRRHLVVERGWPPRAVRVKPFWAPGRKGLE